MHLKESIRWRYNYWRLFRTFNRMTSLEELVSYARGHQTKTIVNKSEEDKFLEFYDNSSSYAENLRTTKEKSYEVMRKAFQIEFAGKNVLELGPGYGEFLRVSKRYGAARIDFIDYSPYILTYNRLCGFNGYRNDYLRSKAFIGLPRDYNVILSKGSISADTFNKQWLHPSRRYLSFPEWLGRLEELVSPIENGIIVLCPTYDLGGDLRAPYKCSNPKTFLDTPFAKHLVGCGYRVITDWSGLYHPLYFPFTFVKDFKVK